MSFSKVAQSIFLVLSDAFGGPSGVKFTTFLFNFRDYRGIMLWKHGLNLPGCEILQAST